ncbi:MAG TPA: IclR family transcriptional regulator [Ilumatobacteraceae bacterium]|nr:IclR family transcriptional regulator [Ilumatobacteraceae bacterium]
MSKQVEGVGAAYPIRAVERVCDILDILQGTRDGVSLGDVATASSLPKSSTFRYLSMLEARRYVKRDAEAGLYRLGLAFHPQSTRELERLVELAGAPLARLRDMTGETANLGVLDGSVIVHHLVVESPGMMRLAARVGDRGPVHSTALGKAICATLPPERVRSILDATSMERFTDHTITSIDDYMAELERVRAAGFAVDDQENQSDGRCLAVALKGATLPCGISISAPSSRLTPSDVASVAKMIRRTATQLAKLLAADASTH